MPPETVIKQWSVALEVCPLWNGPEKVGWGSQGRASPSSFSFSLLIVSSIIKK